MSDNWRTLNAVLERRDELFPFREEKNTSQVRSELKVFMSNLEDGRNVEWRPNKALVSRCEAVADRPVFICGAMKSGTTLLLQLLDAHEKVIAMPGDSHMVKWIDGHVGLSRQALLDALRVHWIQRLVNPSGQKPFWIIGKTRTPYLVFCNYLDYWFGRLGEGEGNGFLSAVFAYYCCNFRRPGQPAIWIEKTPGNELKVDRILRYFRFAKFIHMVRDPLRNLASLKRLHELRGWTWSVQRAARAMRQSLRSGLENQKRLGPERYLVLRYENLVRRPEREMQKICGFVGIDMDSVLLQPTVNGYPATSNSLFSKRHSVGEIVKQDSHQRGSVLTKSEKIVSLAILYQTARQMDYSYGSNSGSKSTVCRLAQCLLGRF